MRRQLDLHRLTAMQPEPAANALVCRTGLPPLKTGKRAGPNGDNQDLSWVHQFGEVSDQAAQVKTLAGITLSASHTVTMSSVPKSSHG